MSEPTAEEQARAILMRLDVQGAENYSSGDLVELANLVQAAAEAERLREERDKVEDALGYYPSNMGDQWPRNVISEIKEARLALSQAIALLGEARESYKNVRIAWIKNHDGDESWWKRTTHHAIAARIDAFLSTHKPSP